jgi:hypothetical protein
MWTRISNAYRQQTCRVDDKKCQIFFSFCVLKGIPMFHIGRSSLLKRGFRFYYFSWRISLRITCFWKIRRHTEFRHKVNFFPMSVFHTSTISVMHWQSTGKVSRWRIAWLVWSIDISNSIRGQTCTDTVFHIAQPIFGKWNSQGCY